MCALERPSFVLVAYILTIEHFVRSQPGRVAKAGAGRARELYARDRGCEEEM